LEASSTKGGYQSENGSCYWQDCPTTDPAFASDCYSPNEGGGGNNPNYCPTQVNCGASAGSCYWADCPSE
jgi:hypothetical protein